MAVPFLLDLFRIPADTFQLFLATSVVNARFGTLMSAVHTAVVALLGTCAVMGILKVDRHKLVRFAIVTSVLTVATVGGTRMLFALMLHRAYDKDKMLASMHMLREHSAAAQVFKTGEALPSLPAVETSVIDRARARRTLRVGYLPDSLPYAFFNSGGDLVGFDVEMAHALASDLGLRLELVSLDRSELSRGLRATACDLVMSGTTVTADRAVDLLFSNLYLDETLAFVVPDHRRAAFSSWDGIRAIGPLRVGAPPVDYYVRKIREELPNAEIVSIVQTDDFFKPRREPLDAFALTAERGSAYTLLHPELSVAVPMPRPLKVPLAYVMADRDQALATVVNTWIELKRKDGTIDRLFEHWILGRDAVPQKRRWSILDDVLKWGR